MYSFWEFEFKGQKITIDKHLGENKYFIMVNGNKVQKQLKLEEIINWCANCMMNV